MPYSGKLIVSKAEQPHSGSKLLASHLGTNSSHLGTIWELSERMANLCFTAKEVEKRADAKRAGNL
jgi:hypothetical protein